MLPNQSPRDGQHQQQGVLGDGDRVRTAIVTYRYPSLPRRFDIEPVVAGAEQLDELEAGCRPIKFGTELKTWAADVIFGIPQRRREFGAVEFGDDEFVARRQYFACDVHDCLGELRGHQDADGHDGSPYRSAGS
jgi:hypothetical protein